MPENGSSNNQQVQKERNKAREARTQSAVTSTHLATRTSAVTQVAVPNCTRHGTVCSSHSFCKRGSPSLPALLSNLSSGSAKW